MPPTLLLLIDQLSAVTDILEDVATDTALAQAQHRVTLAMGLLDDLLEAYAESLRYWAHVPMAPFPPCPPAPQCGAIVPTIP